MMSFWSVYIPQLFLKCSTRQAKENKVKINDNLTLHSLRFLGEVFIIHEITKTISRRLHYTWLTLINTRVGFTGKSAGGGGRGKGCTRHSLG